MNKYNNPRLLNAVVSGTGMKHPIQPHVVVGDVSNGFIRGDLMDANAIVDLVNSGDVIDQDTIRQAVADVIGTAPENLDTLGEIVEALDAAVLDPNTEGSLANQISVINTTIEDNELTIAAALNDLNSRLLELVTRVDALDGGGDTPVSNTLLFKKAAGQQFIIAKYSEEQKTLEIACGVGSTTLIVTDNQGKVNTLQGPPFNDMKSSFEGAVEYAGHEVDTTSIWELSINVDDTVEDWDSYISV